MLYLASALIVGLLVVIGGLAVIHRIDWTPLMPPLVELGLVMVLLYWTTTLLPGPVKKVGKAAGRHVMKSLRKDKRK